MLFRTSAAPAIGRLMAVAYSAILLAGCSGKSEPKAPPPVEVSTVEVQPRAVTVNIDYVAQLEALNTVEIRPRVGGVLEKQIAIEGDRVKKGQLLFVLDQQPYIEALAQAKAALSQAVAALEQSRRDLARVQPLSAIDAISLQELDAAVAKNDANKASVEAAQAQVNTAKLNLGYTTIGSPLDGVMGRVQLKVGGLVTAYTTLLSTVYSTDPMYVNFSISEQRLLEIQKKSGMALDQNQKVQPKFRLLLGDGSEYPEQAKLNFVDAAVDQRTATLAVRLTVPNGKGLLRAGQFARVVVAASEIPDALLVPQRAVQDLQGKSFLWVVDGDGKVQQRDVTMGARIGGDWVVSTGLKPGEQVVVDGIQKVKAGTAVKTTPVDPAKAGGGTSDRDAPKAPGNESIQPDALQSGPNAPPTRSGGPADAPPDKAPDQPPGDKLKDGKSGPSK